MDAMPQFKISKTISGRKYGNDSLVTFPEAIFASVFSRECPEPVKEMLPQ